MQCTQWVMPLGLTLHYLA